MKGCLGCLGILAILTVIVVGYNMAWRISNPAEAAKLDAKNAEIDRAAARDPKSGFEVKICRRAQEYVQAMLKAPATSDFPSCVWNDAVHYAGDGHYNFSSYVDAQNGFGAKIRTYYGGEARVEGQDRDHLTLQFTYLDLNDGTESAVTPVDDAAQPTQPAQLVSAPLASQACEAVKKAILADLKAPADTTFAKCDAIDDGHPGDYTVAIAANISHVDDRGRFHADTFYYGSAKIDPVTHKMQASDLVHD